MRILNKETEEQSISDKSKYEVTAKELDTYKRKANDKDMQLIRDQNMCTRVKDRYSKGIYSLKCTLNFERSLKNMFLWMLFIQSIPLFKLIWQNLTNLLFIFSISSLKLFLIYNF